MQQISICLYLHRYIAYNYIDLFRYIDGAEQSRAYRFRSPPPSGACGASSVPGSADNAHKLAHVARGYRQLLRPYTVQLCRLRRRRGQALQPAIPALLLLLMACPLGPVLRPLPASSNLPSPAPPLLLPHLLLLRFIAAQAYMAGENWQEAVNKAREAAGQHQENGELRGLVHEAEKRLKMSLRKDYYKILGVDR